jgi:Tol biopolymer transport system component
MGRDGSQVRQLTAGPSDDLLPAWSPDGRRIVFDRNRMNGDRDLFIVTVKHRKVSAVTEDPFSELATSWQPLP